MVHSGATLPGRPDGVGSITVLEKEKFAEIKERLRSLLQEQITNFRYAFPFGRPEGALKVPPLEFTGPGQHYKNILLRFGQQDKAATYVTRYCNLLLVYPDRELNISGKQGLDKI